LPAGHYFVERLARENQCPPEHAALGSEGKANTPSAAVAWGQPLCPQLQLNSVELVCPPQVQRSK